MSERWKYQVKTGVFWGLFMIGLSTFMNKGTKPFAVLLTEMDFYFRAIVFLLFGIFVLGYTSWKSKVKRENLK